MFKPLDIELNIIGFFLEGFFYGLYSGIFAIYLQCQASKEDTNKTQKIIFYSICTLYVLSVAVFVCDITSTAAYLYLGIDASIRLGELGSIFRVSVIQLISFGCCDFIAQFILIYRCWIVWGRGTRVTIIPSILMLTFLGTWIAGEFVVIDELPMFLTSLAMSLAVNALVTGLIVFRIFKVFREVKATSDAQILGATGGGKLRAIIFILIESAMALFSIQLARLVVTVLQTDTVEGGYGIIVSIHEMLTGITPTIIIVRTSLGLSFHDEKSMEEVAIESLRFAPNHPNSIPETGSIGIVDQHSRDNEIGVQRSSDIDLVER